MPSDPESILKSLQPIAEALKVAVTEIWKIFVLRYLAKGISELLVAIAIVVVSSIKLWHSNWLFAPYSVALVIAYDAVNLIVNPMYFALTDVIQKVRDESNKS